jgi:hypothetical protein
MFWTFSLLFILGIPLLISIFATTSDEMAESGADKFRVGLALRRMCVNAHWSLAGFYIGATRGVLFPQAAALTRDIALALVCVSLFFGLVGAIALRRARWLLFLIVILSAALFVWFGSTF